MTTTNEFILDIAFHPGETLDEKLQELQIGPKEFAIRTGKPEKTITAVLKGESAITPEMAVAFEDVLQIPARFWLKRQYEYDEYKAREKRLQILNEAAEWSKGFPYAEMAKQGWVAVTRDKNKRVEELFRFFRMSNHRAWEDYFFNQQLKVAFRISLHSSKDPYALSAWICQGERQADEMACGAYSEVKLKQSLPVIKGLMANHSDDFFSKLQEVCLTSGVKVIFTPCIKQAPISGATRWINDNPVIQMTGRYKQNDRFWFTFFHELGHVLLHGKKGIFLEDIEYSDFDKLKEEEADAFAVKWTLSVEEEKEILAKKHLNDEDIVAFAKKFNTHPAMIIGRLQKKKLIEYTIGRKYFIKLDL